MTSSFRATVMADSVDPTGRHRLTTLELTYPRIIHAEFMTHRQFSRNAASSRAIPTATLVQRVLDHPYVPEAFGRNQKGMQAGEDLADDDNAAARRAWLAARSYAVEQARELLALGVHKQHVYRLLEPFQWYTVIVTATEWSNFLALRDHPAAQPEIQRVARLVRAALEGSTPRSLDYGEWHMPLVPDLERLRADGLSDITIRQISVARCARVSYLTHHGERDTTADLRLYCDLVDQGHMSPLEHVARPLEPGETPPPSNLVGWVQLRKTIPNEDDFGKRTGLEPARPAA